MTIEITKQEESLLIAAAGMHRDMERQREKTALLLEQAQDKYADAELTLEQVRMQEAELSEKYHEKEIMLSAREESLKLNEATFKEYKESQEASFKETEKRLKEDAAFNEAVRQQTSDEYRDIEAERESLIAERAQIAADKSRLNKRESRINNNLNQIAATIHSRSEFTGLLLEDRTKSWTDTWQDWTKEEKSEKMNTFFEDDVFSMEKEDRLAEFTEIVNSENLSAREVDEFIIMFRELFPE